MATAPTPTSTTGYPQPTNSSRIGEPVWDIAIHYPPQGYWSEVDYLSIALHNNWMMEYSDGVVEFLPMPTPRHYRISRFFVNGLESQLLPHEPGEVFAAPTPVRLRADKFREPDIFYCRAHRVPHPDEQPNGADLAIEIVSEGPANRERDFVTKREEYARAKIDEYWIVDPEKRTITVLVREGTKYRVHGEFGEGQQATSAMFPAYSVDVTAVFAAGEGQTPTSEVPTKPKRHRRKPGPRKIK